MMSAFRDIGTQSRTPHRRRPGLPPSERPEARAEFGGNPVRQSIAQWIVAVGLAAAVGVLAATCHSRAALHSNQAPSLSPRQHTARTIPGDVGAERKSCVGESAPEVGTSRLGPPLLTRVGETMQLTSFFGHQKESKWTKSLEWEDTSTTLDGADSIIRLPRVEDVEDDVKKKGGIAGCDAARHNTARQNTLRNNTAEGNGAGHKTREVNAAGRPSELKMPICRLAAVSPSDTGLNSVIQVQASPASEPPQSPTVASRPEEIPSPQPALEIDHRPVRSMTIDIRAPGGAVPDNLARDQLSRLQSPGGTVSDREWSPFAYQWEAPGMCHQPLYFEEVSLERLGRRPGPQFAQPVISAAHFFGTVPLLPYAIATSPPSELVYTLGEYRPGSDVPYDLRRPPFSMRGLAVQSAAVTGLILMIP